MSQLAIRIEVLIAHDADVAIHLDEDRCCALGGPGDRELGSWIPVAGPFERALRPL
jgi:hypothetical protein